jgi:hypothetical protein
MAGSAPQTLICGWAAARQAAPLHASAACLAAPRSARTERLYCADVHSLFTRWYPATPFLIAMSACSQPSLAQAACMKCRKLVLECMGVGVVRSTHCATACTTAVCRKSSRRLKSSTRCQNRQQLHIGRADKLRLTGQSRLPQVPHVRMPQGCVLCIGGLSHRRSQAVWYAYCSHALTQLTAPLQSPYSDLELGCCDTTWSPSTPISPADLPCVSAYRRGELDWDCVAASAPRHSAAPLPWLATALPSLPCHGRWQPLPRVWHG